MKANLWIVIIVVVGFLGFLMGYSTPPFMHSGMFSSEGQQAEPGTAVDQDADDYYKDLLTDEE